MLNLVRARHDQLTLQIRKNKDWNKDVLMIKIPIKGLFKLPTCLNDLLNLVLVYHDQVRLEIRKNKDWKKDVLMIEIPIIGLL